MNQNILYNPSNLTRPAGQANPPTQTTSEGPGVPVGVTRGSGPVRTSLMEDLSQSLRDITFGEVMGGMALLSSAFIPGTRGLVRDRIFSPTFRRWSGRITPHTLQSGLHFASKMADRYDRSVRLPLRYGLRELKERAQFSPADWVFAPVETFRELSQQFQSSFRNASTYANHLGLPEDPVRQILDSYQRTFKSILNSQVEASGADEIQGILRANPSLEQDMRLTLIRAVYERPKYRHMTVESAIRHESVKGAYEDAAGLMLNSRLGGPESAYSQARRPMDKFRLWVDRILDQGGLDKGDFHQATLRDHQELVSRQLAAVEGKSGDWYERRAQALRTMQARLDTVVRDVAGWHSVSVDDLLNAEIGRGVYMMGDDLVDVSRLRPGRMLGSVVDSFYEHVHIPMFHANPLDIVQYPLMRQIKRDYNRFILKPTDATQDYRNLVDGFRFGESAYGKMEQGHGAFSFGGHHYRATFTNVERLATTPRGPRFRPMNTQHTPVWGLEMPLFTGVQRMLLGKGLNDGTELNQGYLFGNDIREDIEQSLFDATGDVDPVEVARRLRRMRFQSAMGIGNAASISQGDFSAVGLLQTMLRRRNEPWHRAYAGEGLLAGLRGGRRPGRGGLGRGDVEGIQHQIRDLNRILQGEESVRRRYPVGRFLHSGILAHDDIRGFMTNMAHEIGGDVGEELTGLAERFAIHMRRPTGATQSGLVKDFTGAGKFSDRTAYTIQRALREAGEQGGLDDLLMSRLSRIVPETAAISDETVLEYVQRLKFQQIVGDSVKRMSKKGARSEASMVGALGRLRNHIMGEAGVAKTIATTGHRPQTLLSRLVGHSPRHRRDVQDVMNLAVLSSSSVDTARILLNTNEGVHDTMRRLFRYHRPPRQSEIGGSLIGQVSDLFTVGDRSMQSAFVTGRDLTKLLPFYFFERPLRIRGKMLGERLPVGNILSPFRKGTFSGLNKHHVSSAAAFKDHVKSSFVGSVLLNSLMDVTALGILVYGLKPGGLLDTVTGGYLYRAVTEAVATTTSAFAYLRNTVPIVPYMNVGGRPGTIDIMPGPINLGLSTVGETFRWAEELFPKMVSSPLTQFLVGGGIMWGGFRAGALMGRPGIGALAGLAGTLFSGMNPLDEPTATAGETYRILTGRQEIAHRANRWWLIGSTPFEGNEPLFYRPHFVAQLSQGSRVQSKFGDGVRGKLRHLLYTAPGLGQVMQIANPDWVVEGRPDEMAYMESGVPLTHFPVIGPTLAIALQIFSGGHINKTLSQAGMQRLEDLKSRKVKPENEQEFAVYMGVEPYSSGDLRYLAGLQIRQMQNWLGIFGFGTEVMLSRLGEAMGIDAIKTGHPFLNRPVMESSLEAQNVTRSYEELNLGDPGFSAAIEFGGARLQRLPVEFVPSTEFLRRFLIRRTPESYTVNFSPNPMYAPGRYPDKYFLDFRQGSDYSRYRHYSDIRGMTSHAVGKYSIYEIAAKMAPFSDWSRSVIAQTPDPAMADDLRQQVYGDIRKRIKTEPYRFVRRSQWTPFMWDGATRNQLGNLTKGVRNKLSEKFLREQEENYDLWFSEQRRENYGLIGGVIPEWGLGAMWEGFTHGKYHHRFWARKGWSAETATEEYRSKRIFGHDFAQWERPYATFLKPVFTETMSEGPFWSTVKMGAMSSLFFRTSTGRFAGGLLGAATGLVGSSAISAREYATGSPYIPGYTRELLDTQANLDTLAYMKGEQSMLGFTEGNPMNYLGFPPLERRLLRDMRLTRGKDKEALLQLLPDRLGEIVSPSRYDHEAVKEQALRQFRASDLSRDSIAADPELPFPAVQAAAVQKAGFSPYNFGVYPQLAQVGEMLIESEETGVNYPAVDYRLREQLGNGSYTYMNAHKATQVIRQHDDWTDLRGL